MKDLLFKNRKKYRNLISIELLASANFVSNNVLKALGYILTNKYAEGYPFKRYYGGCQIIDKIEQSTIDRAKLLFKVNYANVQPNSVSQAKEAVLMACLNPGDTILGFQFYQGGHLTPGSYLNFSGTLYRSFSYGLNKETELIDYNEVLYLAKKEKPKLIICGASSSERDIDYKNFREVADQVGATLLADISHTAGFIAKGFLNDPFLYCHLITTTTHKTLRGPIGGVILIRGDFENPKGIRKNGCILTISQMIDRSVLTGCQGGTYEHLIAAKGIAFAEALGKAYKCYLKQVLKNSKKLVQVFRKKGYRIISKGTDNHCMLIDLRNKNITGREAEIILEKVDITCKKNMIPFDKKSPLITSGIRLGTAAITTRGLKENDMEILVELIDEALFYKNNRIKLKIIKQKVNTMMIKYPLFHY